MKSNKLIHPACLIVSTLHRAKVKVSKPGVPIWYKAENNCSFRTIITTSRCFKCVFLKWLIPLDVVAWRLSLFLWALLLVASKGASNNFGFIWFEKGEIFWKETSKRLQKTRTMLQLRDHKWTDLWTHPFVCNVWMIMKCIFKFCKLKLVYFWIQIISRALKRYLERVVLVTECQN